MENDKDRVFSAADIVKRAKSQKNFKTDSELAAFLGISRSTLSNWIARNSIDYPLVLGKLKEVDYNWLLTGKGSPVHRAKSCSSELVQGEVEILHNPKTAECMDDRSVTLYDISAAANLKTLLADRPQYALGKLLLTDDPLVRNVPEGLRWLERAQQDGSSYAGYRLGKECLQGEIVPKDVPKALDYLNDAAQKGNQFAQYTLGKLYLLGQGLPQDRAYAEHWLKLSAEQGNQYAHFFLDRLDQFRPPSVLMAATHLLRQIGSIFRDNSLPKSGAGGNQIDRKLRQREREKKIAMGHKADDHEEYQGPAMSM